MPSNHLLVRNISAFYSNDPRTVCQQRFRAGSAADRRGCLHLRLRAGRHGDDPARDDQRPRTGWQARTHGVSALHRTYPTAEFKDVTAPNADTLYATAWIDVGKEPWVLSLPDANDRYCLFPMLDGWTDFFQVPGKRTTGTGPQTYAITGPGLKGELPPVDGFWSLTMYNADYFFVDNPLNRYTLSARDDLNLNADGSVDLYLQQANPGP